MRVICFFWHLLSFPLSSELFFVAWWIFHSPTAAPRSRRQKQKYTSTYTYKRSRVLLLFPPHAFLFPFLSQMHIIEAFCSPCTLSALRVRDLHVRRVNKESGLTRSIPSQRQRRNDREKEQKVRNLALSRSIVNGLCKWKGHLLVSHTPNTLRRTQFVPPPLALLFCYLFSGAANKCWSERRIHLESYYRARATLESHPGACNGTCHFSPHTQRQRHMAPWVCVFRRKIQTLFIVANRFQRNGRTMEIQNCAFGDAKFELDAEGVALMVFGSICLTRKT